MVSAPDGREAWRLKHLPAPRPVFGLDQLAAEADAPVLIVEGAKKCAPAKLIFPEPCCDSVAGRGEQHPSRRLVASPEQGRRDLAGQRRSRSRGSREDRRACLECWSDFRGVVPVPRDFPPHWDLAEERPPDADLVSLLAAAYPPGLDSSSTSSAAVLGDSDPAFVSWGQFNMSASGLTISVTKGRGDEKQEIEEQVAGAFEVLGALGTRAAGVGGVGCAGGMLMGERILVM